MDEIIMATDKVSIEAQKLESCGAAGYGDIPIQVKILQVPAKCVPITPVQHPPATACVKKGNSVSSPPKVIPTSQGHQPSSPTVKVPAQQTTSSSVMVMAKVANAGGVNRKGQPQAKETAFSQLASMNQATTPGRTVLITVPRAAAAQTVTVAPQLPANIQIPAGMMLIRSDNGQLMLVSQQAMAQQGPRGVTGQAPRILAPQFSGNKSHETMTVIRMAAPHGFQPAPVQKTSVVKVIGVAPKPAVVQIPSAVCEQGSQPRMKAVITKTKIEPPATFSQETLESVKKCKNFLVTLIKLASSDSRSATMANNVRALVRSLLEEKLEAEEFTEKLYRELKSTPQPCLVPFLKKSLPAVRCLTADPQFFIQQALTSTCNHSRLSSTIKQSNTDTCQQIILKPREITVRPGLLTCCRPVSKHTEVESRKPFTGMFSVKQSFTQDPSRHARFALKDSSGSYKEDDDINDVASMAGVDLREENAQILTTMVGSVVQSCQDQLFLLPKPVLSRILHTGWALGVTDVNPEVVALVSHATQECLRGLIVKLSVMAEHRKAAPKEDLWHAKVSDTRSQLCFLGEIGCLKKKREDEEERERLLRLARSRSQTEDPQHQQLKQRAKETARHQCREDAPDFPDSSDRATLTVRYFTASYISYNKWRTLRCSRERPTSLLWLPLGLVRRDLWSTLKAR
ncbi:transcription initiation factor TFIID subunit 4B-like isoform X2 [Acanthopagrus latus]|uniref:transcription initiation factor TFIID subunit 4B-like isoform X2 n=1 Tax=Acanthopagrus latus TaxID=8177 RepID=UPI00187BFF9F|nr:transcription initiation factor TFIID subunit 4B-like isoform X2 [Acanthopagrus latus]